MRIQLKAKNLTETISRMNQFPDKLHEGMQATMEATLLETWGSVPPYPAPPMNSNYRRTGTLGRTLGSDPLGGKPGGNQPEIYEIKEMGSGMYEGRFGTNLSYAPYVIGEEEQAKVHRGRWWTMATIAERAMPKIERLWQRLADTMAKFLEGK